jgi:hypothetical protein
MATTPTTAPPRPNAESRPCPWALSRPTPSGCTICTATYGNGVRTSGMAATKAPRATVPPGKAGKSCPACCAAGRGTSGRGTAAPPTAVATLPTTVTTASGSGSVVRPHRNAGRWAADHWLCPARNAVAQARDDTLLVIVDVTGSRLAVYHEIDSPFQFP